MEVILLKEVARLGKPGQILTVKEGYARNFLIPQGLALPAGARQRAQAEAWGRAQARRLQREKEAALDLARRLGAVSCRIPMQAGRQEKLHGAVTAADIADALAQQGLPIDRHQIQMEKPITQLGFWEIPLKIHPEVTAVVKVEVVPADGHPSRRTAD